MKTRRGVLCLGVGVATILWSGAASADIQTFWKTDFCPDFGGAKTAIAFELGHMEAPVEPGAGVGGAFCVTASADLTASTPGAKSYEVINADVVFAPGDDGMSVPGGAWDCVVCQYEDKVVAHPALSMLGTAALMGGLVTAALFELRRRQGPGSA